MLPISSNGIPYLPDGSLHLLDPSRKPRPLWLSASIFVLVFIVLQWAWREARDTGLEQLVIHEVTVKPAATLVRIISPDIPAVAAGASIKAPGGGLNILNGCEGTEVMFLLAAAFAAVRLRLKEKAIGLALGLVLVYLLNQARILALFYSYRADRGLFDMLHTLILPALLIAFATLYVHVFLRRGAA